MSLKKAIITLIALVLVIGVFSAEAGVSFIGSVKVGGGSVTSSGKVAGCGAGGCEKVTMNVVGEGLTALCQNKGLKTAKGQNPVSVNVDTTSTFSVDENGSFLFDMHTEIMPSAQEAGCPNKNWSVIDLSGPLTVTISVYEVGATEPADSQVFSCQAVYGSATDCVAVQ